MRVVTLRSRLTGKTHIATLSEYQAYLDRGDMQNYSVIGWKDTLDADPLDRTTMPPKEVQERIKTAKKMIDKPTILEGED